MHNMTQVAAKQCRETILLTSRIFDPSGQHVAREVDLCTAYFCLNLCVLLLEPVDETFVCNCRLYTLINMFCNSYKMLLFVQESEEKKKEREKERGMRNRLDFAVQ